jgi:hypothetical protein
MLLESTRNWRNYVRNSCQSGCLVILFVQVYEKSQENSRVVKRVEVRVVKREDAHNIKQQCLPRAEMMTMLVLHCGLSKIYTLRPISHYNTREISNPCVRLEATHQIRRVNWTRCAHVDFCVMQVYQGWNNSGRRFW